MKTVHLLHVPHGKRHWVRAPYSALWLDTQAGERQRQTGTRWLYTVICAVLRCKLSLCKLNNDGRSGFSVSTRRKKHSRQKSLYAKAERDLVLVGERATLAWKRRSGALALQPLSFLFTFCK